MSRGIGEHQRAILAELEKEEEYVALTIAELAERTGRTPRQTRTAVDALEGRGHVVVTRQEHIGWTPGVGAWAYVRQDGTTGYSRQVVPEEQRLHVADGEPLPEGFGRRGERAWGDLTLARRGVPRHGSLVWLPEKRAAHEKRQAEMFGAIGTMLGGATDEN